MISWGTTTSGLALKPEEHKLFEDVLAGHAWVRVFSGTFVVALIYDEERGELIDGLADVAKKLTEEKEGKTKVFVLVSPPIPKDRGIYSGWAAKDTWPALNKRSIQ
jgi:hypothetical protein